MGLRKETKGGWGVGSVNKQNDCKLSTSSCCAESLGVFF